MGKGKSSASASDKRFYDNQRDGFRKIAEQAEGSSSRSVRNREIAETARAAEALVGTERARELVNDGMFKNLKADVGLTQEPIMSNAMGVLENLLDNEALNKPLGSGLTYTEWQGVKDAVQAEFADLESRGYTKAEVAAALAYERYLVRDGANSVPKSSNMVTTYRNGKPEQVPRFRKSANGSRVANTYTTKQFAPYTGIVMPAGSMTYQTSGRFTTQVYKIADIHKGMHGAWLEGVNNGNGFAVNVFKDRGGWYMEHPRLGHQDGDGNWTERYYLEDIRKRIGF